MGGEKTNYTIINTILLINALIIVSTNILHLLIDIAKGKRTHDILDLEFTQATLTLAIITTLLALLT